MNWLIFISGVIALFATIGHFTIGVKLYLRPMMLSFFDDVSKTVMYSVFHYVSVFQIISTLALLAIGSGIDLPFDTRSVTIFIAINYAGFALTEGIIALTSNIEKGIFKMFHWVFFILIAAFAWYGSF